MKRILMPVVLVLVMLLAALPAQAQGGAVLEYGQFVQGDLKEGAIELVYTVEATEGDVVLIEMRRAPDSDLFSVALSVDDPSGDTIADTVEGNSSDVSFVAFIAEQTGTYAVTATRSQFSSSTGTFLIRALNLEVLEAGTAINNTVTNETYDVYYALPQDEEVSLSYVQTDGQFFLSFRIYYSVPDFGPAQVASAGAIEGITWRVSLETDDDFLTIVSIGTTAINFEFSDVDSNFELARE
ncbi:MAG: hypothetical protein HC915_07935 [Anaerolineae bacterium]|nr:hypothetical protein [Anaerolineae bacterium]